MKLFESDSDLQQPKMGVAKTVVLGLQHTFTMFGATVLVPLIVTANIQGELGPNALTLSVATALFMAGISTLFFHLVTRGKMPVFLGSSFAFIAPISIAAIRYGLPSALGGLVVAGLLYLVVAVLVYFLGAQRILSFFPPIVTGPIIMVIGLNLAPNAVGNASTNWPLALLAFAVVVVVNVFVKGFARSLPVLIGLGASYLVAVLLTVTGIAPLVDFSLITSEAWVGLPQFVLAEFNLSAILLVAPVAICTMVEHVGDVIAVGAICKKDFIRDPGLHRTLIGDGVATSLSALFGGPANTTYSENTGVLALTRVLNPVVMRIAACFAIVLGVMPKLGGIINSIPAAIIGGISIVLFGMIAAVGARTLVENKVDFQAPRNLIVAAVILVLGLGEASIPVNIGAVSFTVEGMALAAIVGIILNKLLPGGQKYDKNGKVQAEV